MRLDRYEITVGRFRAFVNAGRGTRLQPPDPASGSHPRLAGSGWNAAWISELPATTAALTASLKCDPTFQTWTDAPGANETRPLNCLSWYEAFAFCIWDGGYLPTEAEWNAAAAGGSEQRAYPWSSPAASLAVDRSRASYGDNFGTDCSGDGQRGCAVTDLVPVGSLPAGDGRWGHSDLAGNLWEWTLDRWAEPYPAPCNDCAQLADGDQRVLRGGSFFGDELFLRSAGRDSYLPFNRLISIGARCARPAIR